eukprot:CAMPEP_0178411472 /NCGR_PEP_ID=MMETSP0689_2-20121128/21511_1 /TAXON_ID=160604 /ORGANISM="Amphidinium massartii, Strain CS-259" /LENGTH=245 /DNA_ID=CAMNT_0020032677 /DNA_START=109 /DNA_END=842 /DNA_ORIENTATION=-
MVSFESDVTVHEVDAVKELELRAASKDAASESVSTKPADGPHDEDTTDAGSSSSDAEGASASESAMSGAEDKIQARMHRSPALRLSTRCRFKNTQLETIPGTPVASQGLPSPPGLSRAAMRRARDSLSANNAKDVAGALAEPAFQDGLAVATAAPPTSEEPVNAVFTRGPSGNPLTPPCKSKKRRAQRDAVKPQWSFGASVLPGTLDASNRTVGAVSVGAKRAPGFVEYTATVPSAPVGLLPSFS